MELFDRIFDRVDQGLMIPAIYIAEVSETRERYLKIEAWVLSKGYTASISRSRVVYIKKGGREQNEHSNDQHRQHQRRF